jgi:hypothetical protein
MMAVMENITIVKMVIFMFSPIILQKFMTNSQKIQYGKFAIGVWQCVDERGRIEQQSGIQIKLLELELNKKKEVKNGKN